MADESSRGPEDTADAALRRLEQRLTRASEAAERLFAEASQSAAERAGEASADPEPGGSKPADQPPATEPGTPPPAGWQPPAEEPAAGERRQGELEMLIVALRSLRDLIPPDLQRRLADAVREVLLALRALIDWYLERVERRRREPAEVQDIPIQ